MATAAEAAARESFAAYPGRAPVEVEADLRITFAERELHLTNEGDTTLVLDLPDTYTARQLYFLQTGPMLRGALTQLHHMLRFYDLELQVRRGQWTIARLGRGSRPTYFSWLLGVGPLQIDIFGAWRGLYQ